MGLDDFKKDVIRVMTKEEFESTINEDIKFVEGLELFLKHDDATRVIKHIKFVLKASVDYYYPNHPESEPGDMGEVSDGYHTPNEAADRLEQYLNQKKSGLTFEEAFKFLKDGNMIKRRGWKNEHLDAFRKSGVSLIHVEKSLIIIINEETRRLTSWNPSIEDISSNDWEITK